MNEVGYPLSTLLWDYARGISGLGLSVAALIANGWSDRLGLLFLSLAILFSIYILMTVGRHMTRFSFGEKGLMMRRWRSKRQVEWGDLTGLSLRYYPISRNRRRGWMVLRLKSKAFPRGIEIDSTIPVFDGILRHSEEAAIGNNLVLDPITQENFSALHHVKNER